MRWVEFPPWLDYSVSEDGAFCKACALFSSGEVNHQKLGSFVLSPFCSWTYSSKAFTSCEMKSYLQDSVAIMESLKSTFNNPSSIVANKPDKTKEDSFSQK